MFRSKAVRGMFARALPVAVALALTACGERFSRDDFGALVKDSSTTEVAKKFGKPDIVDESIGGVIRWTYKSKTFGTEGGTKLDQRTIIVFRQTDPNAPAKAVEVLYE